MADVLDRLNDPQNDTPPCPVNRAGHSPSWFDRGETCSYCGQDPPEVEVIAKALAEWSSEMPWEQRHPKHQEHWRRMARKGYEAIAAEHTVIVAEKAARRESSP